MIFHFDDWHIAPVIAICLQAGACSGGLQERAVPEKAATAESATLAAMPAMRSARALHTSTRLNDGRILIVGGGDPETPVMTAEIYDPASGTVRVLRLSHARLGHSATLLDGGKVLIAGGGYGSNATSARSAEIFDPHSETFQPVGNLIDSRADHAAVLLLSGDVLLLGGDVSGVGRAPTSTAEIFDPKTRTFRATGAMATPRRPAGVVMLGDGKVLVAGGTGTGKTIVARAEIYDPASQTFAETGALEAAREKHTAQVLADGRVLVMGGSTGPDESDRLRTTEFYDPSTGRFSRGPSMLAARHKVTSVLLADGQILVVGGGPSLAEVYNPTANSFVAIAGSNGIERFFPSAAQLDDKSVLITGGYTSGGARESVWRFVTH